MNQQIEQLYGIAQKAERKIIGLMSGTSLDGLDIALCRITGSGRETDLIVEQFQTVPYSRLFKNQIREVFARRTIDFELLCGLNALIGLTHARLVNETLISWNITANEIDLIASHGQTVFHAPQSLTCNQQLPNSTFQIGDGDHIAVHTGIITVSDFRQKHVAAGGEGAPLAAYGDYLLYTHEQQNRILLNIGGIANFTFLPALNTGDSVFSTDVGPGNTLMDQYMQAHFGSAMDEDAQIASSGMVSEELLAALLKNNFFGLPFPRTTGPEMFNLEYLFTAQQVSGTGYLSSNDVMATLCAFSASAIVHAVTSAAGNHNFVHMYVSGGGLHNPLLMKQLEKDLPAMSISSFDVLGLLPDAKEAALFALLANETLAGAPILMSEIPGAPAICMGKISFPH